MTIIYITGIIAILIDLILLYFIRDDGKKVLKRWMILLAILIGCIPMINMIIGCVTLLLLFLALMIEKDFTLGNDCKLVNWLNDTI